MYRHVFDELIMPVAIEIHTIVCNKITTIVCIRCAWWIDYASWYRNTC